MLGSTPDVEYRDAGQRLQRRRPEPEGAERTVAARGGVAPGTSGTASRSTRATRRSGPSGSGATAVGVGAWLDVYAISNHFSSTPDNRVLQRTEQANYLAAIVEALDPDRVVAGGDFNVFLRPDDPLDAAEPAGRSTTRASRTSGTRSWPRSRRPRTRTLRRPGADARRAVRNDNARGSSRRPASRT